MSAGPGADFHPSRHPIETFPFLLLDRSFFLCRLAGRGWSFLPVFCCSLYCWLNKSPGGRSAVESRCGFARLRRGACRSWNGVASQYNGALQEEEKQKLVQPLFFVRVCLCVSLSCVVGLVVSLFLPSPPPPPFFFVRAPRLLLTRTPLCDGTHLFDSLDERAVFCFAVPPYRLPAESFQTLAHTHTKRKRDIQ